MCDLAPKYPYKIYYSHELAYVRYFGWGVNFPNIIYLDDTVPNPLLLTHNPRQSVYVFPIPEFSAFIFNPAAGGFL